MQTKRNDQKEMSEQAQWCRQTAMHFAELVKNMEEKHAKELEEKENTLARMEESWDEEVRCIHRDYVLEKEKNERLAEENTTLKKQVEDLIKRTANIPLPQA